MGDFPDYAQIGNLSLIEEQYKKYSADPKSVETSWRHFFEGIDFASILARTSETPSENLHTPGGTSDKRIILLIQAYRRSGHLLAKVNPLEQELIIPAFLELETLGFSESELNQPFSTFGVTNGETASLKEILTALQATYSSRIGFEYMDLGNPELEKWIQERIEPKLNINIGTEEKRLALDYLNKSEALETFLHMRYAGQTRFSLEGTETAIPILAEIIEEEAKFGIEEVWIGMAHRGRLNVLANILNKPYSSLFEEFEDDTTLSFFFEHFLCQCLKFWFCFYFHSINPF